ncbi:cytochrome P450 [Streptomyces sp. NPDC045470]|uniref:cytochrome P450 n=1 Tax=Streptomyces sp. NPDC045470 TaxID=3155469 RepID=UPI0033EB4EDD
MDPRLSSNQQNPGFPVPVPCFAGLSDRPPALLWLDDAAEHSAQRRLVLPAFTRRGVAALRPQIQQTVDELLDAMVARGPSAELVEAFALPVPSVAICSLLGVSYEDRDFFEEQSRRLMRGPTARDSQDAVDRMDEFFRTLIAHKERSPGDGLLDDIVRLQRREESLDHEELVRLATTLLVAGHETTANMIALGVFTLLQHPERLAEVRAQESLMPAVVEELLRFLSVVEAVLRVAVDDIEVAGTTIRAGEGVVFTTALINRDSTVHQRPDVLDWSRPPHRNVVFGFGMHQCPGQNLARAEMEIALGTLFARLPGLRLAVPARDVPCKPGGTIQGLLELPVTW